MEGDNIPLPILDGKNFQKWKLRMQSILEAKDLDDVVYGEDLTTTTAGEDSKITPEMQAKNTKMRGARAKMIILNAVDDKHTTILAPFKTAREMWKRIVEEYSDKQPTNVQSMLAEYYSSKMEPSKNPSEFIAYIDSLVDRIKETDTKNVIPQ